MPLSEDFVRIAVFLLDRERGEPTGTGFLIVMTDDEIIHTYLVTAKHVVDSYPHTFMRFRTVHGDIHDVPLKQWAFHATEDVAAQEVFFDELEPEPLYNAYPLDDAIDKSPMPVADRLLGERVFFVGLLERVRAAMGISMIPMVRAGTVGALWQERIPLTGGRTVTAHLIDGRSLGGFSGAPCFVQAVGLTADEENIGSLKPIEATRLLGMVIAHYDDWEKESGKATLQLNTGIAIVLPIERLRELIEGTTLATERKDWLEQFMKDHPDTPATLDSLDNTPAS